MNTLKGKIAVVTGGSRGVGKGIALGLGEAGATVYITGRTVMQKDRGTLLGQTLPGSLEETAAEVTKIGGKGIALPCDHRNDDQVRQAFKRIQDEQGTLDILVNNAYMFHDGMLEGKGFWDLPIDVWDNQQNVGLRSDYVSSVNAAQIMVAKKRGLIVNVSSSGAGGYTLAAAYGTIKAGVDRLTGDMAYELRPHSVACVSIWPGAIDTERVRILSGQATVPHHGPKQELQLHVGRAVASLAKDPNVMAKSGRAFTTVDLGIEYGFTEDDGSRPLNPRDIQWPPPPPAVYPTGKH